MPLKQSFHIHERGSGSQSLHRHSIIILSITSSGNAGRPAGVIPYPYRQEADFLYLTGINQQGVAVVQTFAAAASASGAPATSSVEVKYSLFLPPPNPEKEAWDGATLGFEAAGRHFGAHAVYPVHKVRRHFCPVATNAAVCKARCCRVQSVHYIAHRENDLLLTRVARLQQ